MDEISLGSYEDAPRSLRDLMRKYSNTPQQGTDVLGLLKRVYGEGASNLESVLRGSAAAIPGFAGDIGQGFDIRGLRSLPTTEQILSKIPRATRPTKEGAGFEEVGTYLPLPISPGAVKQGAQAVQRGMKAAAPYAARSAVNLAEKYGVAPTMAIVKPQGNLNLTPVLSKEILRGPDVQPVESFLSQAKSTPGVTKDAFIELASKYDDLVPGTKISKTDFEARIPPSEYDVLDLKQAGGTTHDEFIEQAYDLVNEDGSAVFEMVLDRLNIRRIPEGQYRNYIGALQEYHLGNIGPEEMPVPLRRALERDGMIEDPHLYHNLVQEEFDQAVRHTAENLAEYADDFVTASGYRYEDYQRLLPDPVRRELNESNYFEIGVSHPDRAGVFYEHYGAHEPESMGLIGHIRGTVIPADKTDATAFVPGGTSKDKAVINLKPNSAIIEEIQSDAQKAAFSAEQKGALRQVHGTLFKAAVQNALERGVTTIYMPTARTISLVRGNNPTKYASIYDQQIVREGIKPLGKIPGVTINPIDVMDVAKAGEAPKPVTAYYEMNFEPEAIEEILRGRGQVAPGYAAGGLVDYDPTEIDTIVSKLKEEFYG
jgi:hypothetical protein